jgi:hypothetical protein
MQIGKMANLAFLYWKPGIKIENAN